METINQIQQNFLVQELVKVYSSKKEFNQSFSLRAFSKKIGVSSGALTEIFQNKRRVTIKTAEKILSNLNYSPSDIEAFLEMEKSPSSKREFKSLNMDQYEVLSNWHYLALLNLLELSEVDQSPENLASRLGLSPKKIKDAIEKLLKLEMIEEVGGKFIRTFVRYQTSEDIANSAIKKYHHDTLALSEVALKELAPDLRDFSSILLKMNKKNMGQVKKMIRDFQDELSHLVENDSPTEIYHLNVHLYPVTKSNNNQNEVLK